MIEYYSALKKEILPFVTNLDETEGHYASWNKPDPERKKTLYVSLTNGI